jgi:hypothetical protein
LPEAARLSSDIFAGGVRRRGPIAPALEFWVSFHALFFTEPCRLYNSSVVWAIVVNIAIENLRVGCFTVEDKTRDSGKQQHPGNGRHVVPP